ncbi:MAG: hypothetical protein VCE43_14760 [Myxococcota bacterium]
MSSGLRARLFCCHLLRPADLQDRPIAENVPGATPGANSRATAPVQTNSGAAERNHGDHERHDTQRIDDDPSCRPVALAALRAVSITPMPALYRPETPGR